MKRQALPSVLALTRPRHWLFLLLALLVACGGGQDTAGVGTGGTGLKEGNVTGFGSVFIDGVRYDNSRALVQVDDGSGTLAAGQFKLGQRVRVLVNDAGEVSTAEILPALLGPVERAPDAQGYLMVMGQWVRFVSRVLPYQSTLSSSTYLDGFNQLADVAIGDVVEVHGAWVDADPIKGRVLVASRMEKRSMAPQRMLVTSTVAAVNPVDRQFTLATGDGRTVVANAAQGIGVGEWVKVWLDASQVPTWQPSLALGAAHWGLVHQSANPALIGSRLEISGLPVQFNPSNNTVVVQGITAVLPADRLVPDALLALQSGTFSQFVLLQDPRTDVWSVDAITPREGDSLGRSTALVVRGMAGTLQASGELVQVRDVSVVFGNSNRLAKVCEQIDPQSSVTVEIRGTPSGSLVEAESVTCKLAQPP